MAVTRIRYVYCSDSVLDRDKDLVKAVTAETIASKRGQSGHQISASMQSSVNSSARESPQKEDRGSKPIPVYGKKPSKAMDAEGGYN